MTNDKDSVSPILTIQNPETSKELFRINADGTVTGDIVNASEAAKVFFEALRDLILHNTRQPAQRDALRSLLEEARDRIDEMWRNSGSSYEADFTPEEETLLGRIDAALTATATHLFAENANCPNLKGQI
jgi:hypothetical protein